ncbi:hypothetical protein LOTGIDRAFT_130755 [Lottia gigantea]|uniref:G-protein coupled receptors family 3 profile domain-containing protein n=1 Tax=Lottia gigantea TaxID=225164 RepID=V3ZRH1_LOTGI|nr:hypothetical protein LOTGIDRAFT_130755 [Lottia gigantea]ESO85155.1 hypothetical protein LOTGIDRAFT_130755 [Lottia gigantea]
MYVHYLLQIPQISYSSTSGDLSDKSRFEYFSRVVPPDQYQAQVMVEIAKSFKWDYVNTLADEGNYGERGIGKFEEIAKKSGVCVSRSLKIPRSVNTTTFTNIINDILKDNNTAKAVVMFVNEDNCRSILQALKKMNKTKEFSILASDSWGAKIHPVQDHETVAEGTITILPKRRVIKEFDYYFRNLTVYNNQRNPWFSEYWETIFNCSLTNTPYRKRCTGMSKSLWNPDVNYRQEGLVQFVIDSVYALAQGVHDMLSYECPGTHKDFSRCLRYRPLAGEELLGFIRNVKLNGSNGDPVVFDENGDGIRNYDIFQFQRLPSGNFEYVRIGEGVFNGNFSLTLNDTSLNWEDIPRSICSEPCSFGQAKKHTGGCCWMCVPCQGNEYLQDENNCAPCPKDSRPNANKSICDRLPEFHLEPSSLWFILPVAFSGVGVLCTAAVLVIFIHFNTTPVIMACGRELCYLLLLGIFLSYGTSFVMLAKPSVIMCALRRLGLGVSLCFIYAALLTKTNRIYRIFNSGIKAMVKRPGYTSPKSQILICICLVSVQFIGGLTWLGFEKPDTVQHYDQNDYIVLKCKSSQIATVISLFYNIFIIVLCTVYAFKTRKIPQNFNEAKYIAFTMYSTCIVWLAFIPIYFGANHDFKIEIISLCMCVSISATVALFCLFAPKVYIVLLQPHKNVRQATSTSIQSANMKNNSRTYGVTCALPLPTGILVQNGTIHKEVAQTDNAVFSDSMEDTSSCDEGLSMPVPTLNMNTVTESTTAT